MQISCFLLSGVKNIIFDTNTHLSIDINQDALDKMKTVPQPLLLLRPLLGSFDQRFNQQRILGDPRRHRQDALGDPHLPEQRIVAALLNKLLESSVSFQNVFVDGDSIRVLRAESSVGRLPPDSTIMVPELVHQNISYGWYHCR